MRIWPHFSGLRSIIKGQAVYTSPLRAATRRYQAMIFTLFLIPSITVDKRVISG